MKIKLKQICNFYYIKNENQMLEINKNIKNNQYFLYVIKIWRKWKKKSVVLQLRFIFVISRSARVFTYCQGGQSSAD